MKTIDKIDHFNINHTGYLQLPMFDMECLVLVGLSIVDEFATLGDVIHTPGLHLIDSITGCIHSCVGVVFQIPRIRCDFGLSNQSN